MAGRLHQPTNRSYVIRTYSSLFWVNGENKHIADGILSGELTSLFNANPYSGCTLLHRRLFLEYFVEIQICVAYLSGSSQSSVCIDLFYRTNYDFSMLFSKEARLWVTTLSSTCRVSSIQVMCPLIWQSSFQESFWMKDFRVTQKTVSRSACQDHYPDIVIK